MEHNDHIHSHEHTHVDAQGNVYTHSHGHTHEGEHEHVHSQETMGLDKVKALLSYMISHNDHHAEEMADLIDALPDASKDKLLKAIGTFEAANVELQSVLDSLD